MRIIRIQEYVILTYEIKEQWHEKRVTAVQIFLSSSASVEQHSKIKGYKNMDLNTYG